MQYYKLSISELAVQPLALLNLLCVGILQCKEKSAFGWPARAYSEGTDLHPLDKLQQRFLDGLLLEMFTRTALLAKAA